MGSPLVSLIMPAWQPEPRWLRQAVRAALAQQGCAVELIVVDDGSPEPVAAQLEDLHDPRLRTLRVEHGGVSRARNAGIAAARGSHLRFIDSDDVIVPASTARLLEMMGDAEDRVAYGATMVCDRDLRPLWKLTSRRRGNVALECLLNRFTVSVHSLLFSRASVEATGEWDPTLRVCEDWDFVLRTLEHAEAWGTRDTATWYRQHEGAASLDVGAGEAGARRVVERYLDRHPEERDERMAARIEAMFLVMSALGDPSPRPLALRRRFWRAARRDPGAALSGLAQAFAEGALARSFVRRREPGPAGVTE